MTNRGLADLKPLCRAADMALGNQTWSLYDPAVATPTKRFGSPMFLMHRGDLHAMLVG